MGQPQAKRACLLRALSGDSHSLQQSKTLSGRVALPWLQVPRRKDRQVMSDPGDNESCMLYAHTYHLCFAGGERVSPHIFSFAYCSRAKGPHSFALVLNIRSIPSPFIMINTNSTLMLCARLLSSPITVTQTLALTQIPPQELCYCN